MCQSRAILAVNSVRNSHHPSVAVGILFVPHGHAESAVKGLGLTNETFFILIALMRAILQE